ncbi:response regulator [Pseudoalteromonas ruthenica]|uniref:response regulator n=2 Tax=Pseudoalteromonas TaxID=53246 RepID=UPI00110A95C9|nr:response regulator [Pseudoalteromonas ruthenica]TMO42942.1 two-component system response regulator [Pseudoalteromonas ruthenica]TMO52173.1 two-component system response regulator [Pseudoalteromonas ruthenica]
MTVQRVLAVDDEEYNLEIIEEILDDHGFELKMVDSGPACLAVVGEFKPDIILLDVSMPDMNGYDVCRQLKANPETEDIVVMFVSARGTVEERMEGYAVGAEDYIVKPFSHDELKSKLMKLKGYLDEQEDLQKQVDDATSTAFNAMANSSEMGEIVNFVERIGQIWEPQELGKELLSCLNRFGLQSNAELRLDDGVQHFSLSGGCSPIVVELFDMLKTRGRLHEFSQRLLVNYEKVSLLILNMPEKEPEKHGRIRDHVCFLVSVTEQQLTAIMTKQALQKRQAQLGEAVSRIEAQFRELISAVNQTRSDNEKVFRALQEELEERIPTMGLDDDQEAFIYQKVDDTIQRSVAREESVENLQAAFSRIEQDLAKLLN